MSYRLTTLIAIYLCWELASIPIAKTQYDGRVSPPLSLYQLFVYNRQEASK